MKKFVRSLVVVAVVFMLLACKNDDKSPSADASGSLNLAKLTKVQWNEAFDRITLEDVPESLKTKADGDFDGVIVGIKDHDIWNDGDSCMSNSKFICSQFRSALFGESDYSATDWATAYQKISPEKTWVRYYIKGEGASEYEPEYLSWEVKGIYAEQGGSLNDPYSYVKMIVDAGREMYDVKNYDNESRIYKGTLYYIEDWNTYEAFILTELPAESPEGFDGNVLKVEASISFKEKEGKVYVDTIEADYTDIYSDFHGRRTMVFEYRPLDASEEKFLDSVDWPDNLDPDA